MQKIVNLLNFEPILLNQIYNTTYFSPDLSPQDFDYTPFFSSYLTYQSSNNLQSDLINEKDPFIEEIITISNFICNPINFSCYDQLHKLNTFLQDHLNFSFTFKGDPKGYSFLDVMVFSSLHNCKLWSKLYRPGPKIKEEKQKFEKKSPNSKLNSLENLFLWFHTFENTFTDLIKYRFNPSLLDPKHKKKQEKLSKLKKRNPDFINAVKAQDYDKVLAFLKEGVEIKVVDSEDGSSAGHIACLQGDFKLCKMLDDYGINWEAEDLENITPVFNAIESANMDLIAYLYDVKKVNFEHKDFQDRTPFYHACCFGDLSIISYLYNHCHCNPNTKSHKNRTALSKACFLAKHEVVQYLLSLPPHDYPSINDIDDKGRTALHNASWGPAGGKEGKFLNGGLIYDSPESADILIKHGAIVDFADFDGNTPFVIAAASEGIETMKVLFKNGADVNKKNKKGEGALFFSCRFGHMNSMRILIEEMKCDLKGKNFEGVSNLACCLMNDQGEVFDYLKEKEWSLKEIVQYQEDLSYILQNKTDAKTFEALEKFIMFLKSKGIILKFLPEYIPVVASFKNKESFILLYEYFQPVMTSLEKEKFFYQILENNKLNYLQIIEKFDSLFFTEFVPDSTLVLTIFKTKPISLDLLANLIFETNFDIFNAPSFLHFIVDTRKISLVIALRKLFTSDLSLKTNNKFIKALISQPQEIKDLQIIEFLIRTDIKTEMNCVEYAKFKKFFDIEKVLKDLVDIFLKNSELLMEHYHIPYKLVEEPQKDLDCSHEKKPFLENVNQKLLESEDLPTQYQIKNEEELEYFKRILSNPFCFEKKNSFFYIKTEEELIRMVEEIKNFSVFGIDLEFLTRLFSESLVVEGQQNLTELDMPSNSGFVCTIQISTIEKDYIVDAIYLRDKIPVYLRGIFEDFSKIKLFHGCDYDLQWLKIDFNINSVNIFDTARGVMILNTDKNAVSLAKLTEIYLNMNLDKSFQKSFWGMRPLPKVMLDYARLDSRVLMGIFPCVLKDLREKGAEKQMAISCNRICWEKVEKIKQKKTNFIVLY